MRTFLLHLCFLNEHKLIFLNLLLIMNLYSHAVVRKNTERFFFFVFFSQLPSMVTSCKTTVQDHNQDSDIDSVKI